VILWSATEEEDDEEELGKIAIVRQPNHRPVMGQQQTTIGTPVQWLCRSNDIHEDDKSSTY